MGLDYKQVRKAHNVRASTGYEIMEGFLYQAKCSQGSFKAKGKTGQRGSIRSKVGDWKERKVRF